MTILQAIILGVIQGATEFIPISSSGHLVITPLFLGWSIAPQEAFVFDVLVQVATLAAVLVYFWDDLRSIGSSWFRGILTGKPFQSLQSRLGWFLILATIPAGIAALLFKDTFELAFSDPRSSAIFLIFTGIILWGAEQAPARNRSVTDLNGYDVLLIGLFQTLALFPGVSRSGSTITGGMFRGLTRKGAARFSFLMSVPIMLAAGVLAGYDLLQVDSLISQLPVYLAGFVTAAVVGYLSIRWLLKYLSTRPLTVFSLYCLSMGTFTLAFLIWS